MLSLPQTITVDIATPTIDALPDGAAAGAPGGAAHRGGFAATMLATQPVATNTVDQVLGADEALPVTGNTLPQQIEIPIEIAGASQGAATPTAALTESSSALPTATDAHAGTPLDAAPAPDTVDAIVPTVTIAVAASLTDAPLADVVDVAIPATSANETAPAGLINPQSLLEGAEVTDTESTVDVFDLASPPATAGATPGSDVLRAPLLSPVNFTDQQLQSLRENSELLAGIRPNDVLRRSYPAGPALPHVEPEIGLRVADGLQQAEALRSAVAQVDSAIPQALTGKRAAIRDDMAPILTARLNGIPGILSSRQHGLPSGQTVSGDSLAVPFSPRPVALPGMPAPLGSGLPETRISLHGTPQIVDADADPKSLQRMLAPPATNTIAAGATTPVTAQPVDTMAPAIVNDVRRPDTVAQNLTRGAQPTAVLANSTQDARASLSLRDALQAAQPAPNLTAHDAAVTTPPQPDMVPPISIVAPPRYAKPSTNTELKVPVPTAAVAAPASPDLMTVDSAPIAAKPEAGSATLPPAVAMTTPLPAATTGSTTPTQILNLPVTDNAWGAAISERVAVLAGQKILSANIRLNPTELGPLRVEIKVDDGNAQVHFVAQHAVTREAIEQAMPRLRELLAAEGLNLTGADVSEQGVARDRGEQSNHAQSSDVVNEGEPDAPHGGNDESVKRSRSDSLVDTFA